MTKRLANYLLCEFDHTPYTRFEDRLQGRGELNILNVETQPGITAAPLPRWC